MVMGVSCTARAPVAIRLERPSVAAAAVITKRRMANSPCISLPNILSDREPKQATASRRDHLKAYRVASGFPGFHTYGKLHACRSFGSFGVVRLLVWCVVALGLICGPADAARKAHAIARLVNREGKPAGTVDFATVNRGVLITFDLQGLPPGAHAVHLHASGNCDAKSGFTSAGPILTLIPGKQHGYLAEGGPAAGDLPNQFAGADGRLHASTLASAFSLGNGKRSIFDRDGVAVILDARGDDYRTQPLGNAGDRIACGVVVRTVGPAARPKFFPVKH